MKTILHAARWVVCCILAIIAILLPVVFITGAPGEMASLAAFAAGITIGTYWWRRGFLTFRTFQK